MYEIYFLDTNFSDTSGKQNHYAVVVAQNADFSMTLDTITSQYEKKSERIKLQYYVVEDWQKAGLKKPSYIDILSFENYSLKDLLAYSEFVGKLTQKDQYGLADFIETYSERLKKYDGE
jgi:hypothetical protein